MYIIQRNHETPGAGFSSTPESVFAAAGFSKTGEFDVSGERMGAAIAPKPEEPEPVSASTENLKPSSESDEPTPAPAPTVEIDTNKLLEGRFNGKFKSIDEVEARLSELEKKEKQDPFANDYIRNLNKAVSEGIDPDVYKAVNDIKVEKLSPTESLVLKYQWDKGISKEEAEFLVERTYKLDLLDINGKPDMDDPEVREAQLRLKIDAQEATKFLTDYKANALTSPVEKHMEEMKNAWSPEIPKVVEKFKNIVVSGKSGTYTVPASTESLTSAQKLLSDVIDSGVLDEMPTKDGLALAESIVEKELLKQNAQAIADHIADFYERKHLEEKHNPRPPNPQGSAPVAGGSDAMYSWLKAQRG